MTNEVLKLGDGIWDKVARFGGVGAHHHDEPELAGNQGPDPF